MRKKSFNLRRMLIDFGWRHFWLVLPDKYYKGWCVSTPCIFGYRLRIGRDCKAGTDGSAYPLDLRLLKLISRSDLYNSYKVMWKIGGVAG